MWVNFPVVGVAGNFKVLEACRGLRGTGGKSDNHASGDTIGKSFDYLFYFV